MMTHCPVILSLFPARDFKDDLKHFICYIVGTPCKRVSKATEETPICTERKMSYYIDVVRLCPLLLGIFILTADVLGGAMVRTEIPSEEKIILNAVAYC